MTGKAIPAGVRRAVPREPALRAAIAEAPTPRTGRVLVEPVRPSLGTLPTVMTAPSAP